MLGLSSLPDSFRYLVIHPERHCLNAASSVNTSRLGPSRPAADASREILERWLLDGFDVSVGHRDLLVTQNYLNHRATLLRSPHAQRPPPGGFVLTRQC